RIRRPRRRTARLAASGNRPKPMNQATQSEPTEAAMPPSSGDAGEARRRYLAEIERAFTIAQGRARPADDRTFALAGNSIRLRFAGERLPAVLGTALAHLPPASADGGWEILCWDGAATGRPLPSPPGPWPETWPPDSVFFPFGPQSTRVCILAETGLITVFCAASCRAVIWVRDARELPGQHYGSPLLNLFAWWSRSVGLSLLHAGCVGTERGAVLLVGPGGSGKSTTSLLCAEAGMDYLSDDYCLARLGDKPTAYSLYCSGKLQREHWASFPGLARIAVQPPVDPLAKPIVYLSRVGEFAVKVRAPRRAILVPTISGQPATTVETTHAAAALHA